MNNRYSWLVKLIGGGLLAVVLSVCYFGSWGSKADAKAMQRDMMAGVVFQVEVEGRWKGVFKTCSGIGSRNDIVEYKATDKAGRVELRYNPGRLQWHNVVLSRGLTSDTKLWSWRQEVEVGKVAGARQKCTITMMSQEGKPVAVWDLAEAWPSDLTAGMKDGENVVTEEVTITHDGATRKL